MNLESINDSLNLDKSEGGAFTVHWRAVFAGIFISMLAYLLLSSLGVAIGATEARRAIDMGQIPRNFVSGLGTWMIVTILVSLFVGSYASGRVSGFIATRVGYIQGVVISALFFGLLVTQAGAAMGMFSSGLGAMKDIAAGSAQSLMSNSDLTETIEDNLGGMELRSDVKTVASGLFSRLARGDSDAAIAYLAAQTGLSRPQAQARFEIIQDKVLTAAADFGRQAASVARSIASFFCAAMILGTLSAMFGGALGAQFNIRKPVDKLDRSALRSLRQTPAYTSI
jgi:hypothetical protein